MKKLGLLVFTFSFDLAISNTITIKMGPDGKAVIQFCQGTYRLNTTVECLPPNWKINETGIFLHDDEIE